MRILFITIMCYCFLSANFIEIYRNNGIDAVQKELERIIKTKKYWDKYLKDIDVRYGYYESINSVLICNKDKKNITLYKKDKKQFIKNFTSSVFIGEKSGDKQKEGDLKTPIGVYKLTAQLTNVDSFYGPLALVTSYPNLYDRIQKKSGSGIWIHGLPYNKKRDNFTKGCVALDNTKLETLNSKINYKNSIILLSETKLRDTTTDDISNILSQIYIWKEAWQKSDIKQYLSFYDKDFKKTNGMNFDKFSQYKARIFKRTKKKSIYFKNINISPYANNNNKILFKVVIDEDYKAKYYKFKGKKELYIELKKDGKISIIAES